jgi:hypothetical protein
MSNPFRLALERFAEARQTFTESFEVCVLDYVFHSFAGEVAERTQRSSIP